MDNSKFGKYVVSELKVSELSWEYAKYTTFATHVLSMDSTVAEGVFLMNCSWYIAPTAHMSGSHTHDCDEIIGFFGGKPEDPLNFMVN